jgi:hypothetical protein
MQNVSNNGVKKVSAISSAVKPKHTYTQDLQDDWCNAGAGVASFAARCPQTSYREIKATAYDFVNGCNHDYKFCLTFCSRMRLSLLGFLLATQGIRTLKQNRIPHEEQSVIFNKDLN